MQDLVFAELSCWPTSESLLEYRSNQLGLWVLAKFQQKLCSFNKYLWVEDITTNNVNPDPAFKKQMDFRAKCPERPHRAAHPTQWLATGKKKGGAEIWEHLLGTEEEPPCLPSWLSLCFYPNLLSRDRHISWKTKKIRKQKSEIS